MVYWPEKSSIHPWWLTIPFLCRNQSGLDMSHTHLVPVCEHLGTLMRILITLDEIISGHTVLKEHWTLYKRSVIRLAPIWQMSYPPSPSLTRPLPVWPALSQFDPMLFSACSSLYTTIQPSLDSRSRHCGRMRSWSWGWRPHWWTVTYSTSVLIAEAAADCQSAAECLHCFLLSELRQLQLWRFEQRYKRQQELYVGRRDGTCHQVASQRRRAIHG